MSSVPCCDLPLNLYRCKGTHYFSFHQIYGENLTQFNFCHFGQKLLSTFQHKRSILFVGYSQCIIGDMRTKHRRRRNTAIK